LFLSFLLFVSQERVQTEPSASASQEKRIALSKELSDLFSLDCPPFAKEPTFQQLSLPVRHITTSHSHFTSLSARNRLPLAAHTCHAPLHGVSEEQMPSNQVVSMDRDVWEPNLATISAQLVRTSAKHLVRVRPSGKRHKISTQQAKKNNNNNYNNNNNQPANQPASQPTNQPTNQPTDRPTDQPTNRTFFLFKEKNKCRKTSNSSKVFVVVGCCVVSAGGQL
jgi:hypothetical protein